MAVPRAGPYSLQGWRGVDELLVSRPPFGIDFFALANRAGNAKQPTYLLSGSLPAEIAIQHLIERKIVASHDPARPENGVLAIGFTHLVTPENYLHLKWEPLVSFSAGEAETILNAARALLDSEDGYIR
jgi:hypothetical protein